MAWETRVHRPCCSGLFGGRRIRHVVNEIALITSYTVSQAMQDVLVIGPIDSVPLFYATNIYQRIYVTDFGKPAIEKSVRLQGDIYSTSDPDGEPPTWTIVSGTQVVTHGRLVKYEQMLPPLFDGLDYVGLQTTIYQRSSDWAGPFTVRHELWCNSHRLRSGDPADEVERRPQIPFDLRMTTAVVKVTSKQVPDGGN